MLIAVMRKRFVHRLTVFTLKFSSAASIDVFNKKNSKTLHYGKLIVIAYVAVHCVIDLESP